MKPNEFGHTASNLQQPTGGGGLFGQHPFWWQQPKPAQTADSTVNPKDKKKKKKLKPTNNFLDFLKANNT
jgi:hypothetical protein